MDVNEVVNETERDPFIPFLLHLTDGRRIAVRFRTAAVPMKYGLLIFKGIRKEGSHVASGYEQIPYDRIARIDSRQGHGGHQRRRKAS